ncbi:Der GTPase-activating protein YihI [Alteromonadaceae bacterium BrNp21-10]|nr:Der GTPase-activating protein YihI [Alteromonadaceae bacterium BrNp21-10]
MPKIKKNRKVGLIGVRSTPKADRAPNKPSGRPKKHSGKPSGNRQNVEQNSQAALAHGANTNSDNRHGSKKPVQLVADKPMVKSVPKPKFFSPKEELAAIEKDPKLEALLNKVDNGKRLKRDEQDYVDQQLSRHKTLCSLLGISSEKEDDLGELEDQDLFDQFENSNLDNFR